MSKPMKTVQHAFGKFKEKLSKPSAQHRYSPANQPTTDSLEKPWLNLRYHDAKNTSIKKPDELENEMKEPTGLRTSENILSRIQGSMIGMALGDALGAHVEFRPHQYLVENPVYDLQGGGTWGLRKGQFTDDTSMALCLANSLVSQRNFEPYDQLVRYKWWQKLGYMSSTGQCFDIGAATSESLNKFDVRQKTFARENKISYQQMDTLADRHLLDKFDVYCSHIGVAGNGALMRLAPVPLFFYHHPSLAVEYSGQSGLITHGDVKAYDACRYYGALIVAALHNYKKHELLSKQFYRKHTAWFGKNGLCDEIRMIAEGSYQKPNGYKDGIRGKGYIVNALEAALWAFWSDDDSFEKGALAAVNLGDDTDTTAAIYGQLAGAYYGYENLPQRWLKHVYARNFMLNLSKWIAYEGEIWQPSETMPSLSASFSSTPASDPTVTETVPHIPKGGRGPSRHETLDPESKLPDQSETTAGDKYQHRAHLKGTDSRGSMEHAVVPFSQTIDQVLVNENGIHPNVYAQHQSRALINDAPLKKTNSGTYSSLKKQELYNPSQLGQRTSQENDQRRSEVRKTLSIPSSDKQTHEVMNATNQGALNKPYGNSKSTFNLNSSKKDEKTFQRREVSAKHQSQHGTTHHDRSIATRYHGRMLGKTDDFQGDSRSAASKFSTKQLQDPSSTVATSASSRDYPVSYSQVSLSQQPRSSNSHGSISTSFKMHQSSPKSSTTTPTAGQQLVKLENTEHPRRESRTHRFSSHLFGRNHNRDKPS